MHILLIEPDLSLAEIYQTAIQLQGHTTSHSKNAQEAVRQADKKFPDLVILELELAIHNGIEFLYEFRSYPEWQNIPVIVLSHLSPNHEAIRSAAWEQLGVVGHYYKPATKLAELLHAIDNVPAMKVR